jgi:hypothetical protein
MKVDGRRNAFAALPSGNDWYASNRRHRGPRSGLDDFGEENISCFCRKYINKLRFLIIVLGFTNDYTIYIHHFF